MVQNRAETFTIGESDSLGEGEDTWLEVDEDEDGRGILLSLVSIDRSYLGETAIDIDTNQSYIPS